MTTLGERKLTEMEEIISNQKPGQLRDNITKDDTRGEERRRGLKR